MTCQIIVGDALDELRKMESDSIDCCVTSPPYWGLRDYGIGGQMGLEASLGEHIAAMVRDRLCADLVPVFCAVPQSAHDIGGLFGEAA